jgi:hypothetical protein
VISWAFINIFIRHFIGIVSAFDRYCFQMQLVPLRIGGGPRTMLTAALRAEGLSANAGGMGSEDAVRNRLYDLRKRQGLVLFTHGIIVRQNTFD